MLALTRRNSLLDVFDDVFRDAWLGTAARTALSPLADVRSDEGKFTVEMELPGVDPENVEISLDNGVLTIRGEKKHEKKEEGKYERVERYYGSFARTYRLPEDVDGENIEAKASNGVLTVVIPRKEKVLPEPKKIKILTE